MELTCFGRGGRVKGLGIRELEYGRREQYKSNTLMKRKKNKPIYQFRLAPETKEQLHNIKGEGKTWDRFFQELLKQKST